jgi:hypothetical protein
MNLMPSVKCIFSTTSAPVNHRSHQLFFLSNTLWTVWTQKNKDTNSDSDWDFSPPSTPERPSFETKRELVEHKLRTNGDPSQFGEEARRRVSFDPKYPTLPCLILGILKALVRDGFRCIATRKYDHRPMHQCTELTQEVANSDVATTITSCVHIFPQSIAKISDVDDKDAKVRFADLSSVTINHAHL